MNSSPKADLQERCEQLRSLHTPGDPLLLPNVWDVATAPARWSRRGFPSSRRPAPVSRSRSATRTTRPRRQTRCSRRRGGCARRRRAGDGRRRGRLRMYPADQAPRCGRGGRRPQPRETDHAAGATTRSGERAAQWLAAVREAASADNYPLVINARVDVLSRVGSSPAPTPARKSTWCPKPWIGRTPTSRSAPTACTRSRCGSPTLSRCSWPASMGR